MTKENFEQKYYQLIDEELPQKLKDNYEYGLTWTSTSKLPYFDTDFVFHLPDEIKEKIKDLVEELKKDQL